MINISCILYRHLRGLGAMEKPALNHTHTPGQAGQVNLWGVAVLLAIGVAVGVGLHAVHLRSPVSFSSASKETKEKQAFEFLYLDSGRVEAYLAQLERGVFAHQRLSHKLTQSVNGEVAVQSVVKAGASSQDESFVERVVTPTAASLFVELLDELDELNTIGLGHFESEVHCGLHEGDFVSFETHSLRPPTYLNPYLAVSQAGTLSALFPMPSRDPEQRELVESRRAASRQFRKQVGENPRAVFAIQPHKDRQLRPVKYLLPMSVSQLTDERSLIKYGGGDFTIVGKVVRIFPRPGDCGGKNTSVQPATLRQPAARRGHPAYVDSPTRETWEHPLEEATGELICRTNPRCARKVRKHNLRGEKRLNLIEVARAELLTKMRGQTRIQKAGAVIIPVAIYK